MSHQYKSVIIQDRNGKVLGTLEKVPKDETVEGFKKIVNKDVPAISKKYINNKSVEKRNISIHRIRLTIGDARGNALTDKCKNLQEYCKTFK